MPATKAPAPKPLWDRPHRVSGAVLDDAFAVLPGTTAFRGTIRVKRGELVFSGPAILPFVRRRLWAVPLGDVRRTAVRGRRIWIEWTNPRGYVSAVLLEGLAGRALQLLVNDLVAVTRVEFVPEQASAAKNIRYRPCWNGHPPGTPSFVVTHDVPSE